MININSLNYLNYFRGVASIIVILYHIKDNIDIEADSKLYFLFSKGYLAVDFFFILSGFVISYSYQNLSNKDEIIKYLKKRFLRIYPLHFFTLLMIIILIFLFNIFVNKEFNIFNDYYTLKSLILNFLLIHSWGILNELTWNVPSWSISTEFFAYLFFPIFFNLRNNTKLFLFIIVIIFYFFIYIEKNTLNYHYDYGIIRNLASFILGYYIFKTSTKINFNHSYLIGIITLFFALFIYYGHDIYFILLVIPFFFTVISTKYYEIKILKFLGKISFSIYMNQWVVIGLLNNIHNRYFDLGLISYIALTISLTILLSSFTYYFIEKKFYNNL